ncbi:MAG: hypothetical protein ABIS17_02960 [Casimicrobiaceae bacterium]
MIETAPRAFDPAATDASCLPLLRSCLSLLRPALARRKRVYRRSDALGALGLPPDVAAGSFVATIRAALVAGDRPGVQRAARELIALLTAGYRVPPVRVQVLARRPSDDYGELHGLYEPGEGRRRALIAVWMRTAQRQQVVAFKTFLRPLKLPRPTA